MHCRRYFHIVGIPFFLLKASLTLISKNTYLKGVDSYKNNAKQVEDYPMVDRSNAASEGRESEEFLRAPDLVDSIRVFHFFLLDSLLVHLG